MSESNPNIPDMDPLKAILENKYSEVGYSFIKSVLSDLSSRFEFDIMAKADTKAQARARELAYSRAFEGFSRLINRKPTTKDIPFVAKALTEKWYGQGKLETRAESRAVKAFLVGYFRESSGTIPKRVFNSLAETKNIWLSRGQEEILEKYVAQAVNEVMELSDDVRGVVANVLMAEPQQAQAVLQERFGILNRDWRGIALTSVHSIHANGQLSQWVGKSVKWVAANDACPVCKGFDGKTFKVKADPGDFKLEVWPGKSNYGRSFSPFTREGRKRSPDEMAGPVIPAHPHCLVGDTNISALGVSGYSKRWSEGEFVTIRTASGKELTATPNHPVLTSNGWVAIGELNKGHQVIHSLSSNHVVPSHLNDDYVHGLIEDVTNSSLESSKVTTCPVPLSPEDFHGDGGGSKVAIIGSNSHLGYSFNTPLEQGIAQDFFASTPILSRLLSSLSGFDSFVNRAFSPFESQMRTSCLSDSLLGTHFTPLNSFGLGLGSEGYTHVGKPVTDSSSRYPIPLSDRIAALAGNVGCDNIVQIKRFVSKQHVYNLETSDGFYLANGIITHNCRCTYALVMPKIQADPRLTEYLRLLANDGQAHVL
jgi:hypothetical protein